MQRQLCVEAKAHKAIFLHISDKKSNRNTGWSSTCSGRLGQWLPCGERPEKISRDAWSAVMHCSFIRPLVTQASPQYMKRSHTLITMCTFLYIQLAPVDVEGLLYDIFLYKGLEYLWILVTTWGPGTNPSRIRRDHSSVKNLKETKDMLALGNKVAETQDLAVAMQPRASHFTSLNLSFTF